MSPRAHFWLYAVLAFLLFLMFVQALFPADGAEVDLIHPTGILAMIAEVALVIAAYHAWRDWRRRGR